MRPSGMPTFRAPRTGCWIVLLFGVFVAPNGASATTRFVPEQYPTIQAGIDASSAGDTVLLSPGEYRGIGNREIELRGLDLVITSRDGSEATVIDCEYEGRAFYLHERETRAARIERITILNGWGRQPFDYGGAIQCDASSPTIADCVIRNCSAENGGGIGLFYSNGLVQRCVISANRADTGGGLDLQLGNASIEDCVITDNSASTGGGVAFTGVGANILKGCTISSNWAGSTGGGIRSVTRAILERCILWENSTWLSGGPEFYGPMGADVRCCDIDTAGVVANAGTMHYDGYCIITDPMLCNPVMDDWLLRDDSPCLPENSPCGELIGALSGGCIPPPTGACCLPNGSCAVMGPWACNVAQGQFLGIGTVCVPDPCHPSPIEESTWGRIKVRFRAPR